MNNMDAEKIRKDIHNKVKEFFKKRREEFIPNQTPILTGMAVFDDKEVNAIISSVLDGWFGLSKKGEEFEKRFAKYIGTKHCILVNSGSSANLLALNSIKNNLKLEGGEIITPACTFPTTFNPILQLGFKPAVIDVDKTLNITPQGIIPAINKKTKGIMFAHTMGNPAKISEIKQIADENNLFLIEDCCDALGSKYENKFCGSFGTTSTHSFYPAHAITMGEGGAVNTDSPELKRTIISLRDWGRDCWCRSDDKLPHGRCGKRFEHKLGDITYDHRYVYSQIGYNLKPLEFQAAMAVEQLKKIDTFDKIRRRNFKIYSEELAAFDNFIELPEINKRADPVFFGLPIIINNPKVKRKELLKFLNKHKIATRLLFAGNILRQPAYKDIKYSKYQDLTYTDKLMRDCFWVGIHPGISQEMIRFVVSKFKEYFSKV